MKSRLPPGKQNQQSSHPLTRGDVRINYYMDQFYFQRDDWLWIRVPKNASTSVRAALNPSGSLFEERPLEEIDFEKVKTAFMVTRDPFTRARSCWANRVEGKTPPTGLPTNPDISRPMGFKTFIHRICEIPDDNADHHFRSQSWFLKNVPVDVLTIRLENLKDEWPGVQSIIKDAVELPFLYSSPWELKAPTGKRATYFYDDEMRELMYQRFKEDFERFNYE